MKDMEENKPKMTCPTCGGKGWVELPEYLRQTLQAVIDNPGLSTHEIFQQVPNGPDRVRLTAIHNRLTTLKGIGLVRREGAGKSAHPFRWFPV